MHCREFCETSIFPGVRTCEWLNLTVDLTIGNEKPNFGDFFIEVPHSLQSLRFAPLDREIVCRLWERDWISGLFCLMTTVQHQ